MSVRTCCDTVGRGCFRTFPEADFPRQGRNRDGTIRRGLLCRECKNAAQKEWSDHNPDKARAIKRRTYVAHREKIIDAVGEYQAANREHVNGQRRERHAARYATDAGYRSRRLAAWARYREKKRGG